MGWTRNMRIIPPAISSWYHSAHLVVIPFSDQESLESNPTVQDISLQKHLAGWNWKHKKCAAFMYSTQCYS